MHVRKIFNDEKLSNVSILIILLFCIILFQSGVAYGHFFGATKTIDNYQIIFSPSPAIPLVGNNSTTSLNFSVLENNTNIYNMYASLTMTEKQSGHIVKQIPYKLYEFSDISFPYTFNKTGDYVATLEARITGDQKYQANPLVASFDISASNQLIPFDELMLFYVTPASVAIAGIAIYLHSKNKL